MTNHLAHHSMKPKVFARKLALGTFLSTSIFASGAIAQQLDWWFDVEVILFERHLAPNSVKETFKQSAFQQANHNMLDLLTPYLQPDLSYLQAGLPYCRESNRLAVATKYQQDFALPITQQPDDIENSDISEDPNATFNKDTVIGAELEFEDTTATISTNGIAEDDVTEFETDSVNDNNQNVEQVPTNLTESITMERPPIQVEFIEWQIPKELLCVYAEQVDPSIESIKYKLENDQQLTQLSNVPTIINGLEWHHKQGAFLLPKTNLRMSELYSKIKRQRDISPILHMSWRQEVEFGRDNAQTVRLFAGKNYSNQFDINGYPIIEDTDLLFDSLEKTTEAPYIPEQELTAITTEQQLLIAESNDSELIDSQDLMSKIDTALVDDSPLTFEQLIPSKSQATNKQLRAQPDTNFLNELWQLDGGITVYLRNVGRVPYLHIDSNLDFRRPIYDAVNGIKTDGSLDDLSTELLIETTKQDAIEANLPPQPNYLQSINFNQLRRVISKQVHYFDHPLFGMVVLINRYRWPIEETEEDPDSSQDE